MAPRERRITVTEGVRNFADIVNRAFCRNETTVLLRNGTPVAHIAPGAPAGIPASEALARWRLRPRLGKAAATAMKRDLMKARRELAPLRSPWD